LTVRDAEGNPDAHSWVQHFQALGEKLQLRIPNGVQAFAHTG